MSAENLSTDEGKPMNNSKTVNNSKPVDYDEQVQGSGGYKNKQTR
ncbi:hypothetical protein [Photobacterium ganghwense]